MLAKLASAFSAEPFVVVAQEKKEEEKSSTITTEVIATIQARTMFVSKETNLSSSKGEVANPAEKSQKYACEECGYSTTQYGNLSVHIAAVHRKAKPYHCTMCGYAATQYGNLKIHIRAVHEKLRPYQCSECDYSASYQQTLNQHIAAIHRKIKPFVCPECSYTAIHQGALRKHTSSVHSLLKGKPSDKNTDGSKDNTVNMQEFPQKHKRSLDTEDGKVICELCNFTCNDTATLRIHRKNEHAKNKEYKCPSCKFTANVQNALLRHVADFHTEKDKQMQCLPVEDKMTSLLNGILTVEKAGCDSNVSNIDDILLGTTNGKKTKKSKANSSISSNKKSKTGQTKLN